MLDFVPFLKQLACAKFVYENETFLHNSGTDEEWMATWIKGVVTCDQLQCLCVIPLMSITLVIGKVGSNYEGVCLYTSEVPGIFVVVY